MVYGDSAARGRAIRLIREESEALRGRLARSLGTFNCPAKAGRWYKAVIRDMQKSMGQCIVMQYEQGTGKHVRWIIISLELFEDEQRFTAYMINRRTQKVDIKELPVTLTIHYIQRHLQDGMGPSLQALAGRMKTILPHALQALGLGHPIGQKVTIPTEFGITGAIVSRDGDLVFRTWIPRSSLDPKQEAKFYD